MKCTGHYDRSYYEWQQELGKFGGTADLIKFAPRIADSDNVIDFGCGGGFLLANLRCSGKIGIELNALARQDCDMLNIEAAATIDELPAHWADKIISNHALEHVANPFETIQALRQKLKQDGIVIFVVPCEGIGAKYVANDRHQHLYTWTPINLGNLFKAAGYEIIECKPFFHRWIPKPLIAQKVLGWRLFHHACWAYGFLFRGLSQVRVIATPSAVNESGT